MAVIIRKVAVGGTGDYYFLGIWDMEMLAEHEGREAYVSIMSSFQSAKYYVTKQPVLEYLMHEEDVPEDLILEFYETGIADLYRQEEQMTESPYYSAWLYLNSHQELAKDLEDGEILESLEDAGKDVDKMDLMPIAETPRMTLYPDDDSYPGYTVLRSEIFRTESAVLRIHAEAVLIDHKKKVYLEASWTADAPDKILFETNRTSVHELLKKNPADAAEQLAEIRKEEHAEMDMDSALRGRYAKVCSSMVKAAARELSKAEFFRDTDEAPEWYLKNRPLI